jgi:type VI secretion system ImpA family protein
MNSLANRDFTFDAAKLMVPISEQQPSGEPLRYDPVYDQIREARREDDPEQERGVWKITLKKAEWPLVESLCLGVLETRSKDLQVAAWLAEAWLQRYGLPGVTAGLTVLNELTKNFWPTIHPLPEDGDIEYRIAPFEWVNEKLSVILKTLPITNPTEDRSRQMCLADWENACRARGKEQPARGRTPNPDVVTQETFQESLELTTTSDLSVLFALTTKANQALKGLTDTLDEKCQRHSPGIGQVSTALNSIQALIQGALGERPQVQPEVAVQEIEQEGEESLMPADADRQNQGGNETAGPIRSRADAYRRLAEAADYLSRTEPHSPTPYLVKRAIGWGQMKFEDLLPELVRNNSELSEIYRLLQIGKVG